MTTLIVGCGYLGRRLARLLIGRGGTVWGTTRGGAKAGELAALGVRPIVADVTSPGGPAWPECDAVFLAVGFDRRGGVPMRRVYVEGLEESLRRIGRGAPRIVYASTTGVYGQDDGGWVDEDSATAPRSESGRVCLGAEGVLRDGARRGGWAATILRYSGLYGPGRLLRGEALVRGEAIAGDPEHWLNLVHVEDAARFAAAALEDGSLDALYVVSDDRPVRRREFYGELARLLGAPEPRFVEAGGGAAGRDASNKRVRAARIKARLGMECHHPDYGSGLAAVLRGIGADNRG